MRDRTSEVARYGLNAVMELDHVIQVHEDGTVTDAPSDVREAWAPELHGVEQGRETVEGGWDLMTDGYTGQDSYNGPIMHDSESIGGRLENDILATPGYYVAVCCTWDEDDEDEDGPTIEGWAVAYRETLTPDSKEEQ